MVRFKLVPHTFDDPIYTACAVAYIGIIYPYIIPYITPYITPVSPAISESGIPTPY
jgi:hypothetical protein